MNIIKHTRRKQDFDNKSSGVSFNMMTVSILVNGQPLYTRTIHRIINEDIGNGKRCYELDDGTRIWHDPVKGIIELAKEALDHIEPVGVKKYEV